MERKNNSNKTIFKNIDFSLRLRVLDMENKRTLLVNSSFEQRKPYIRILLGENGDSKHIEFQFSLMVNANHQYNTNSIFHN